MRELIVKRLIITRMKKKNIRKIIIERTMRIMRKIKKIKKMKKRKRKTTRKILKKRIRRKIIRKRRKKTRRTRTRTRNMMIWKIEITRKRMMIRLYLKNFPRTIAR
jgi:hypothetical protein